MTEITKTLKDAAYIGVGLGVLGFQRAMVLRQDLRKELDDRLPPQAKALVDEARDRARTARRQLTGMLPTT